MLCATRKFFLASPLPNAALVNQPSLLLITGAKIIRCDGSGKLIDWITRFPSPYVLHVQNALDLGLRVLSPNRQPHDIVNCFETDNPCMFYPKFCADNNIPVVVGHGPLTDMTARHSCAEICKRQSYSTAPQRWIRVQDVRAAGWTFKRISELPTGSNEEWCIAVKQSVPFVKSRDVLCVHVDEVETNAPLEPNFWDEELWPRCFTVYPFTPLYKALSAPCGAVHARCLFSSSRWYSKYALEQSNISFQLNSARGSALLRTQMINEDEVVDKEKLKYFVENVPCTANNNPVTPANARWVLSDVAFRHGVSNIWSTAVETHFVELSPGVPPVVLPSGKTWFNVRTCSNVVGL